MCPLLACTSLACWSLWLVESGVKDLDARLESRRQVLWEFESLRQRVARYRDRRDEELVVERAQIELAFLQVARDWRRDQPIGGLYPQLRESDDRLALVFVTSANDQGEGGGR